MEHFKKHGVAYKDGGESGLRIERGRDMLPNKKGTALQSHMALEKRGIPITGENYVPSKCDCGIPPWEICEHSTLVNGLPVFEESVSQELQHLRSI